MMERQEGTRRRRFRSKSPRRCRPLSRRLDQGQDLTDETGASVEDVDVVLLRDVRAAGQEVASIFHVESCVDSSKNIKEKHEEMLQVDISTSFSLDSQHDSFLGSTMRNILRKLSPVHRSSDGNEGNLTEQNIEHCEGNYLLRSPIGVPRKEVQLWTIGLLEQLFDLLLSFATSIAKYYFDERGNSPIGRFLRPDMQGDPFVSSRRVTRLIFAGLVLSAALLYFTEDAYVGGSQPFKEIDYETADRVTNASDFPVHIAFRKVGCELAGRSEPVLAGVTGEIRPGRVTAILGRSGSGKTTLANLILGRSRKFCARQLGNVYMNGQRRSLEVILDRVGFVPQDDVLYPELSVFETLSFNAESRLPRFTSKEYKKKVIQETLEMLGLTHRSGYQIGWQRSGGLSGGEAKRVSIGMELVTHPSVLIMDEPTSGLDSAAAFDIMRTLRDIADRGVAVVAVLHQPTTRIYNFIDDLILLQNGRPVYVGSREKVLDYFSDIGFAIPVFDNSDGIGDLEDEPSSDSSNKLLTETSPPELIVDILAGVVPNKNLGLGAENDVSSFENGTFLYNMWLEHGQPEEMWKEIEVGLKLRQNDELKVMKKLFPSSKRNASLEESGPESCDDNYPSVFRYLCFIAQGLFGEIAYPIRPKPGLLYQIYLWFVVLSKIALRSGIWKEVSIVILLAFTVGFTKSYNTTWNRRAVGGFFVSLSLSLVGMLGALFNDNIAPVQRAADAGMVLGAYQFAQNIFVICKGFLICNAYASSYFTILYLRRGVWCTSPFSLTKYLEFLHMILLLYLCAHGIGSVICLISLPDMYHAYIILLAIFICVHTFAFFAPNKTQIQEDSLILGSVRTEPLINFLCSLSYVRYFMEGMMLWEPLDEDIVGRNTSLRYFGYKPEHRTMCYTCLFAIWAFNQAIRFLAFTRVNRNAFNALHDTPMFIIFVAKVVVSFIVSLLIMTIFHELPRLRRAFRTAMRDYNKKSIARARSSGQQ